MGGNGTIGLMRKDEHRQGAVGIAFQYAIEFIRSGDARIGPAQYNRVQGTGVIRPGSETHKRGVEVDIRFHLVPGLDQVIPFNVPDRGGMFDQ
jgi:hypothetical protein